MPPSSRFSSRPHHTLTGLQMHLSARYACFTTEIELHQAVAVIDSQTEHAEHWHTDDPRHSYPDVLARFQVEGGKVHVLLAKSREFHQCVVGGSYFLDFALYSFHVQSILAADLA